ncbi:SIMPL domain-containing protein [Marinoscillum furvescens]|uniref:Uncharacterized protein YggE n=1 Tax=Marinoscillum furvescens DSM 4134 TaxID=1122208 RepID=A0A3D9L6W9_MARFU|nr:SIMPL domain-containing protein [Marinoscillum furvescens]REE02101.1 uncharacterized protein YggE [Marinoscillum furvescens DSM 4134]
MKHTAILLLIILPFIVQAQFEGRSITVYGSATTEVAPDEIYLHVHFARYERLKQEELEERQAAIARVLQSWKIKEEDIAILEIDASRGSYSGNGNKVRLSKSIEIRRNTPDGLTDLMLDLLEAGVATVEIAKLEYTSLDSMKLEVTKMAMHNARKKAEIMAASQGEALGQTILIRESENSQPYESYSTDPMVIRRGLEYTGAVSRAVSSADVPEGLRKIPVTVDVKVIYALEHPNG